MYYSLFITRLHAVWSLDNIAFVKFPWNVETLGFTYNLVWILCLQNYQIIIWLREVSHDEEDFVSAITTYRAPGMTVSEPSGLPQL